MPHYKSFFDRDYIYAFDLNGKEHTVTIDRVTAGELTSVGGRKTKKPLLYFKGRNKPLALNSTNAKIIAKMYGTDVNGWTEKGIIIYPTITQMAGEDVDCIRVRPYLPNGAPAPTKPEPSDNDGGAA